MRDLTPVVQLAIVLACLAVIGRMALGAWVWYEERAYWNAELEWLRAEEQRHQPVREAE